MSNTIACPIVWYVQNLINELRFQSGYMEITFQPSFAISSYRYVSTYTQMYNFNEKETYSDQFHTRNEVKYYRQHILLRQVCILRDDYNVHSRVL